MIRKWTGLYCWTGPTVGWYTLASSVHLSIAVTFKKPVLYENLLSLWASKLHYSGIEVVP